METRTKDWRPVTFGAARATCLHLADYRAEFAALAGSVQETAADLVPMLVLLGRHADAGRAAEAVRFALAALGSLQEATHP